METPQLIVKRKKNIATITINRPDKLNALNKSVIEELHSVITQLEADESTRIIILTGQGKKAFVAGADISEFASFSETQGRELAMKGQHLLFDTIENLSKPVIAAINGYALGGGLELAMACHIRVASFNAKMGLPETSLGLIPGYGGTQRLPQIVGKSIAMEMILTAKTISAEEAHGINLVNHVTVLSNLLPNCESIANQIMNNSPQAIMQAIHAINSGYDSKKDGYQTEIENFGKCFGTTDFIEGTTAFLEKRKPKF